jgi:pimeloyl-ACP methyl ester carboxylesterase
MSHAELLKTSLNNGVTLAYRLSHPIDKTLITIVMFHSFLMDSRLYEEQFENVRYAAYNLIAIDEHGHGGTTGRETDFTFWDTASDSLELLTKLGIDRFYVLGTSQGGFIALRMALLEPQRIQGLILLGTTPYPETMESKMKVRRIRDKWCETETPSEEALLAKAESFGGPTRIGENAFAKVKQMWVERHLGPDGYNPALNCLVNRDGVEDRLGEIKAPVLVLHGSEDKSYPAEDVHGWVSKLPNVWKFEIVERGMHYLSFTEPGYEVCAQLIPEFIKATS